MHKDNFINILKTYKVLIVLILLILSVGILNPSFFTLRNIFNTLRQTSINSIIAFGMAFVILSGGIDLSVGSTLAISSAMTMYSLTKFHSGVLGIVISIIIGATCGCISGLFIAKAKLQPFIVTLVMMNLLRGLTLVFTDGKPITINFTDINPLYDFIGNGKVVGIPFPIILMAFLFLISYYILYYTKIGRYIYAIGGNEQAAKLSGINVDKIKIFIYTYAGILAAIAGIILSSRLSSAQPTSGEGYELDAIAAVVVGGTSLSGGIGFLGNTLIGALIIGIINNALNLLQVSSYYQTIVKALVILIAVILNINKKSK